MTKAKRETKPVNNARLAFRRWGIVKKDVGIVIFTTLLSVGLSTAAAGLVDYLKNPDYGQLLVRIQPRGSDNPLLAVCVIEDLPFWEGRRSAESGGECVWDGVSTKKHRVRVFAPSPLLRPFSSNVTGGLHGDTEAWGVIDASVGRVDFVRSTPLAEGVGWGGLDAEPEILVTYYNPGHATKVRAIFVWGENLTRYYDGWAFTTEKQIQADASGELRASVPASARAASFTGAILQMWENGWQTTDAHIEQRMGT